MGLMDLNWVLLHSVYNRAFGFGYSKNHDQEQFSSSDEGVVLVKKTMKVKPEEKKKKCECFQMPLHYPRYSKTDYERMEEWKVDLLLHEYGLCCNGSVEEKRSFAMGAFLWPEQL